MSVITPIRRDGNDVVMLDQRRLPFDEVYVRCATAAEVADAIRSMVIRGAPAIGVAAAFGMAVEGHRLSEAEFDCGMAAARERLAASRPTAVNLFWALDRMVQKLAAFNGSHAAKLAAMDAEAQRIYDEDLRTNRAIGRHGAELVPSSATILTHCNAGGLATAGYGTALGVIRAAVEAGKQVHVIADETRPYLQGARLTAWECVKEGIGVTLIADSAAGHLIAQGRVDLVVVGADRVAANGDAANKIGTYQVAVLCHRHNVPFYVAAPLSTIDMAIADGSAIPIENRPADEVTCMFGHPVAPLGVQVENPAFDVTPAELIHGIITERGVARAPFVTSLAALMKRDRNAPSA